jgi:hypothetical protein
MNEEAQFHYRFSVILLLIVLVCSACGARKADSSFSPFLTLMAQIPQSPVNQSKDFVYFMDHLAMEFAYNVSRPPSYEAFGAEEFIAWWVVGRETLGLISEPLLSQKAMMVDMIGFDILEVDQAAMFNVPSGLILTGSFDTKAVSAAYQTNLDFEANDFDGKRIWCWVKGCTHGGQQDLRNAMGVNPFGGSMGQRQPMIISDDILMASSDLELVLAHLDTAAGTLPSLADDPVYRAAVEAISQDAYLLQAIIINETLTRQVAEKIPTEAWHRLNEQPSGLETYLKDFHELPPYELLILGDTVTKDEQITRLGIVYQNVESAEIAGSILLTRLVDHQSEQYHRPFGELLTLYNVTDPRYFVHQDADRATLVLEFPTQKADNNDLIQMRNPVGYDGASTPPGLLYRLFFTMFIMEDTAWLSNLSRAELEAIQIGTLVGVQVSAGFSDIPSGIIGQASFGGVVMVELDDGTLRKAVWDKSLGDQVMHDKLVIVPSSDPYFWRVLKIVEIQ